MTSQRQFYDHYWTEGFSPTGYELNPAIARLLEGTAGSALVDVGCGDGSQVGRWAAANGRNYQGFDISQASVEFGRQNGFDTSLIADASELPLADESIDTVICLEVLEHLFLPADAVREMIRVLRPGGSLVITVPNVAHWRTRMDLALLGRWVPGGEPGTPMPWRDPHIRFFSPVTLRRMLADMALEGVRVGGLPIQIADRVPVLRDRVSQTPGRLSRLACDRAPTLFAAQCVATARKPGAL